MIWPKLPVMLSLRNHAIEKPQAFFKIVIVDIISYIPVIDIHYTLCIWFCYCLYRKIKKLNDILLVFHLNQVVMTGGCFSTFIFVSP